MRILRLALATVVSGVLAFSAAAQEFEYDALPSLSPETGALISTGITAVQRNEAITDFFQDGEQGGVLLTLARAGDRDAARIIGRECLRNAVCITTRKESHDLLVAAARTEWLSAEELAAIYRDGAWGGQAYPVSAAQWLGHAHKLGSPNVAFMLDGMPIEAIREAGVEHLMRRDPVQTADQKSPSRTYTDEEILTALDFWLGPVDPEPAVIPWPGRAEGFPVFADTQMNNLTDIAMSCHIIGAEKVDAIIARKEAGQTSFADELTLDIDGTFVQMYFDTFMDAELNGGATDAALASAYNRHQLSHEANPNAAPSADYCRDKFPEYLTVPLE